MSGSLGDEPSACHRERDAILWHARDADADGVVISRIKHIHKLGGNSSATGHGDDIVFLQEVATQDVATGIAHEDVAAKLVLAYPTGCKTVLPVAGGDTGAVDIDLRLLRGVDSGHDDVGHEALTRVEGRLLRHDKSLQLIYTDILQVDVGDQSMENLALGIAHIILKLGEEGDGSSNGHVLKHVFLPVLTEVVLAAWHLCGEVALDDGALARVGDISQDTVAVAVDGIIELLAFSREGSEHDGAGSVDIVGVVDIVDVAVRAVSLFDDGHLQRLGKVVEGVAHVLHLCGSLKPLAHLLGVRRHLVFETAIDFLVGLRRVAGGAVQALLHDSKAMEHFRRHVKGQHRQKNDIHEVDHLLTRRDRSFLDSHLFVIVYRRPRSSSAHVDGHGLYHAGINLVQLVYLLSHLTGLGIDFIDCTYLLAGTLELHLINLADAREGAVEILHLLTVAGESRALVVDFLQRLHQRLQLFHIVALSLIHGLGLLLRHLRHISGLGIDHSIGRRLSSGLRIDHSIGRRLSSGLGMER